MNENENVVVNEGQQNPEQVEQPIEQTTEAAPAPKMFTQEEVNEIVGKAKARTRAKIEKKYEEEYGGLRSVLEAGTGKKSVSEMTDAFADFYRQKGINIPSKPTYSAKDLETLAKADAQDIINSGFEEVVEEVDRLAGLGVANMSERDKAMFKVLAEYRQNAERGRELSALGVTEDVFNSQAFKDFAGKFVSGTPIKDIYEIYAKTQPKKEHKTMGSMKSNTSGDSGVKDFYTFEEANRFTKKDLDNNPALVAAIEKSMLKWK